MFSTIMQLKF